MRSGFVMALVGAVSLFSVAAQHADAEGLKERILNSDRVEDLKIRLGDVSKSLDADRIIEGATDRLVTFSKQIASITPQLEDMGYQISILRMQMLPPKGLLRLVSELDSEVPFVEPAISDDISVLEKAILVSASKAKQIQTLLELNQVVLDIDVDINPSIRVSYRKDTDFSDGESARFSDIDLMCGQAL